MSSDQKPSNPICTINPYKFLEINQNPVDSITRLTQTPSTPAAPDPTSPVLTQDFPLNPTHKTFLRLFLPNPAAVTTASPPPKLPIILYFHGGGFVFHHADSTIFHNFCSRTAALTAALVVSVEYRLAPEHRLPAAYEDAVESVHWIRDSANKEGWLLKYADFSNCFLMGSSAGGNIAYHAALQAALMMKDLDPLKISGLILHQPFFGGSGRTGSEIRLVDDPYVPLSASDLFWELGLPVGAGRDHEYCNPRAGCGSGVLGRVRELGWRVLVTGCSGDPLVDRAVDLVELLEENDVIVKGHFTEGGYRSVDIFNSGKCNSFLVVVKDFMNSSLAA